MESKNSPPGDRTERLLPTIAYVERQFFHGKEPVTEKETKNVPLRVHRFLTEPAKVSVSMGLTINLGNFNSCRIDVSLSTPCYREETEDAYTHTRTWVESRLTKEVDDIRANRPKLIEVFNEFRG
jgi:hypothetical protein